MPDTGRGSPAGPTSSPALPTPAKAPRPRWWKLLTRLLTIAFIALIIGLLTVQARAIKWGEVHDALIRMRGTDIAAAAVLAFLSFLVYSCYDLIGRAYTGHPLRRGQVMLVAFISYAFNLNMGSLVGGIGFRYRLYSRLGLDNGVITRVLGMAMLTNWVGYMALTGVMFSARMLDVPPQWRVTTDTLQYMGFAFLVLVAGYIGACARWPGRSVKVGRAEIHLPPLRMAAVQFALSATNWLLMGGVAWLVLGRAEPYATVFCVLMVGAVAGILTHIPGNLGVLEAVFVALLANNLAKSDVLAGVLAYRATYYIAPLIIATIAYVWFEARNRPPG